MKTNLPTELMKNKLSWLKTSLAKVVVLAAMLGLAAISATAATTLTQTGSFALVSGLYPQYMGSGTSTRLPVVFRATVTGLTASTTYRYYINGAISSDIGGSNPGAGNPLFITTDGSSAFTYSTGASLSTAGNYSTFTTDASGNYTGWFAFVYTSNNRFTAGNTVYPVIVIGSNTGTTLEYRAAQTGISCIAFGSTSTTGTGITGGSSATAKNFVALYDNVAGTGTPLTIALVESIGVTVASEPSYYSVSASAWNSIIPNTLANGVRRIAQFNSSGSFIGGNVSANGTWGAVNTVNPSGGTTALSISSANAPLNAAYTVTYNGNGFTGGSVPTDSTTYAAGALVTAAANSGSLVKSGSTFAGWNTQSDGNGTTYTAGSGTFTIAANTTLYAKWTASTPTITGAATATAFTTTYGTASTAQSFSVSGANLTADITATAPTGFEISTNSGTAYATTAIFKQVSGSISGTLYVRLAATATVSGAYNSQNIALTSSGATTVNIATASSGNSVSAKGLTITGLTGANKVYDGTTSASFTGTAAYSGLVNGESFSVSGTPSASFATATVGNGKTITVTGYTAPSGNYTVTQPTLNGNITAATLTYTANPASMTYSGTVPSLSGTISGFVNSENQAGATTGTLSFTTSATSGSPAGSYAINGSGLSAANYTFVQAEGNATALTVNKATPTFSLISSANPTGYKAALTFTANSFAVTVSGTVQFITNGINLGSPVTISGNSAGSITAAGLPRGTTNVVSAIYSGDINYLSITNTLTQTVTNHPPVASANTYTRNGFSTWKITVSDLLTNASDVIDGDVLSLDSIQSSTSGVTLIMSNGYVLYANNDLVDDTFTYTVTDGFGGTNTAIITLTADSANGIGGQASTVAFTGGTASVDFAGIPSYKYNVQVSTNLTDWNTIWTTNAPASGLFQFNDNNPPTPAAYYRLMWNGN